MKNKAPVIDKSTFLLGKREPEQQEQEAYSPMFNDKGTNALATIPTTPARIRQRFTHIDFTDQWSLFTADDVEIRSNSITDVLYGQATQFYYYLLIKFTKRTPQSAKSYDFEKKEAREILIDTEDYLKVKGKAITPFNKKNAVKEIKRCINTLLKLAMIFTEKDPKTGEEKPYFLQPLSGVALEKKNRSYSIILNKDVLYYLTDNRYITQFPMAAFHINTMKHPSAFSLAEALSYFYSMNRGKSNQGIISLGALLKRLSDIPQPEEFGEDRHFNRRIIDPIEEDLDHLLKVGVLKKWEWANAKRAPLTTKQLKEYGYKALAECYINYSMEKYPDDKPAIEAPVGIKMSDLKHPEKT